MAKHLFLRDVGWVQIFSGVDLLVMTIVFAIVEKMVNVMAVVKKSVATFYFLTQMQTSRI